MNNALRQFVVCNAVNVKSSLAADASGVIQKC